VENHAKMPHFNVSRIVIRVTPVVLVNVYELIPSVIMIVLVALTALMVVGTVKMIFANALTSTQTQIGTLASIATVSPWVDAFLHAKMTLTVKIYV